MSYDADSFHCEATYSAEDNKLRLYPDGRLDQETYEKIRGLGFRWAPKQELFVTPAWSPEREDICIELAGVITAEQTTLIERAEAKADRLDGIASRRAEQANAFQAAAMRLSERFAGGQPILVGHHSERKARKDQERMHGSMDKAVACQRAVQYWAYRAEGVERHANYKNKPAVRLNRIKRLLADLRDLQRTLNHSHLCRKFWLNIAAVEDGETLAELVNRHAPSHLTTGPLCRWDLYRQFENDQITAGEFVARAIEDHTRIIDSLRLARKIEHTLNRLGYERGELGTVPAFTGELTATILQAFAREHGAHKPKAEKVEGRWCITSTAALPLHLADGETLTLDDAGWVELMQSSGYAVPEKKPGKPPILNFKAEAVHVKMWGSQKQFSQIELTKEEFNRINKDYRGVAPSICGQFRVKVCKDPNAEGSALYAPWVVVYLTDSKTHDAPESGSIVGQAVEA